MLQFLRRESIRRRTCHQEVIYGENRTGSLAFYPADDARLMRATIPPHRNPASIFDSGSFFEPPLHFHPLQAETFTVLSGTIRVCIGSAWVTADAGNSVTVPARELHRFENGSMSIPLAMDVQLNPPLQSDEAFFRNAYSYAEDCSNPPAVGQDGSALQRKGPLQPNFFQVALFLYDSGTIPGIPFAPRWLADPVMHGLLWFSGVFVGRWLLGFQSTYREYYDPKSE